MKPIRDILHEAVEEARQRIQGAKTDSQEKHEHFSYRAQREFANIHVWGRRPVNIVKNIKKIDDEKRKISG